jgi:hypothetical protein
MPTTADQKDFLHALHGVDFPASRIQIVNAAKDTGGLNGEVVSLLEHIPERTYATAQDLTDEVLRTFEATNPGSAGEPAAASEISDADMGLISTMADPRRGEFGPGESESGGIVTVPEEDGDAQAAHILSRNRELMDTSSKASAAGEAGTGVGHTVNSDRSHVGGDFSND